MQIKPLADRVVIKRFEAEEKTSGGILLPDTAKDKPQKGTVLAVGPGKLSKDGKHIPLEVKEGDVVLSDAQHEVPYFSRLDGLPTSPLCYPATPHRHGGQGT